MNFSKKARPSVPFATAIHMLYTGGRAVLGKTHSGRVFPNTHGPNPVNNIFVVVVARQQGPGLLTNPSGFGEIEDRKIPPIRA